jgi:hypothetical protein
MRRSRPDDPAAVIEGRAEPYDDVDGVFRRSVRMETGVASSADGGLLLSVREFPIWMNEMRRPTLVSPAHARLLFTPTRLNTGRIYPWGMAWLVDQVRGRPLYAMGGEGPGFFARMQWSPHADTSVFNCTNTSSGSAPPHLGYCGLQVMEMFAPGATPVSLAPIRDRRPARTEEAFAILTRGENPINAERLASELRIKSGGPLAGEIASTSRTVRSLTLVEEYTMGGVAVRRYRLNYDDANNLNHLRVGYAPDGRICWFGVVLG